VLELGRFDALFFADVLSLRDFYKGNFDTVPGYGGQMGLLDPLPLIAIVSHVTNRLGLGLIVSTSFEKPFQLARSLATLDTLSKGRIAWNVASRRRAISASRIILTATRATIGPMTCWRRALHCGGAGRPGRSCWTRPAAGSPNHPRFTM
jgi:hypothetical protein